MPPIRLMDSIILNLFTHYAIDFMQFLILAAIPKKLSIVNHVTLVVTYCLSLVLSECSMINNGVIVRDLISG